MKLTVTCTSQQFYAYWYGTGDLIDVSIATADFAPQTYVLDYGDDEYRAQYQADRFASGLIFASLSKEN